MSEREAPQLYLVTPPDFDPAAFAPLVKEALAAGPVACFQLWLPQADEDQLRAAAKALRDIVQGNGTAFVLNGSAKLAAALGCDGVHLDQATARDVKAAKAALGDDAIVGVSARTSRHEAITAAEGGADYVSFGPIFDTATKDLHAEAEALGALQWWAEMMEVPSVAVGGITADNLAVPVQAGADFICAVSAVWDHLQGPAAGVRALDDALKAAL